MEYKGIHYEGKVKYSDGRVEILTGLTEDEVKTKVSELDVSYHDSVSYYKVEHLSTSPNHKSPLFKSVNSISPLDTF